MLRFCLLTRIQVGWNFREAHGVIRPHPSSGHAQVLRTKDVVQIEDIRKGQPYLDGDPSVLAVSDIGGARTIILVPMLKDDVLIGVIGIFRQAVLSFTDKQVELVKNFAAQAVIAIENARLLSELHQRTDDLTDALEQQTATSEVLKVISRSVGELEPVFQALLANAVRICGARFGNLTLKDGDMFRTVALHEAPPEYAEARRREPLTHHHPNTVLGQVLATTRSVQISDVQNEPAYYSDLARVNFLKLAGARTVVGVPLLKEAELVLQALDRAPTTLTDAGYKIEHAAPPYFEEAAALFFSLIKTEEASSAGVLERFGDDALKRARASTMAHAVQFDLLGYVEAMQKRTALLREWQLFIEHYPIILMLVSRQLPFAIDADQKGDEGVWEIMTAQAPLLAISILGLPALAAPTGVADGVPTGVQLVAGRFQEELCLAAASVLESAWPVLIAADQ